MTVNLLNNSEEFVRLCWPLAPEVCSFYHPEATPDPASGGVFVCNQTRNDQNPGVLLDVNRGLASDWALKRHWTNPSVAIAQLTLGLEPGAVQLGFEYALGLIDVAPPDLPQVFRDLRARRGSNPPSVHTNTLEPHLYFHPITAAAMETLAGALPAGVQFTPYWMVDLHGATQHVEVRMAAPGMPKEIRPFSWVSTEPGGTPHWRAKAPSVTQLYRTEHIAPGAIVLFCEGPKTADAAQIIFGNRVVAVSLASNMLGRTTFEALIEHRVSVVVWPDHDAPGFALAGKLMAKLAAAGLPCACVLEHELRDFPDKWDLADQLPEGLKSDAVHDVLQAVISRLPRGPDPSLVRQSLGTVEPFPTDVLPAWVRDVVTDMATAASCPVDYVVTTLFAVVGVLMTGVYTVSPRPGFSQHCILFCGNGGAVSMRKTPGQRAILDVLDTLQGQVTAAHIEDHKAWLIAHKDDPAAAGDEPRLSQVVTSSATVESLMVALGGNDYRAILMACDELDEWLTSMTKYSGAKGSGDVPIWLSLHDPRENVLMNRASFNRGSRSAPLVIPMFGAGVVGSMQDDVLREILAQDMTRSVGLLPRLLLVRPDHRPVSSEHELPSLATLHAHQERLLALFTKLWGPLTPARADGARTAPTALVFSAAAHSLFANWYETSDKKSGEGFVDGGSESKASGHIVRLAGILHVLGHGLGLGGRIPPEIPEQTVRFAMRLRLVYFRSHAKRLERIAGEPEHERLARSLARYIVATGATTLNTVALKRDGRVQGLSSNQTLLAAIAELIDARWVVDREGAIRDAALGTSRLPNITLLIHPEVHRLPDVTRLREFDAALEAFHV